MEYFSRFFFASFPSPLRRGPRESLSKAQPELSVLCCAVVVKTKGSASTVGAAGAPPVQVTCTWSERSGAAGAWVWKKLVV